MSTWTAAGGYELKQKSVADSPRNLGVRAVKPPGHGPLHTHHRGDDKQPPVSRLYIPAGGVIRVYGAYVEGRRSVLSGEVQGGQQFVHRSVLGH